MALPNDPTQPSWMGNARLAAAILGALGILAGIGSTLVLGFDVLPRALLAAGILFLGIYVALDPEDVWHKLSGRSTLYGGNVLVVGLSVVVILGLVDVLASRYQTQWDLTANHQYSLSQESVKVAQSLPAPVTAYAYFTTSNGSKSDYQTLLDQYVTASGGKLSVQFVDPNQDVGSAVAAGVRQDGTTIFQMGDKKQTSTATQEQDVTSALLQLTRPAQKVYFTTGHGELDTTVTDQTGISEISQQLGLNDFTTAPLNLATQNAIPTDAAAVVIAGAKQAFSQDELDAISAYLQNGGAVMILEDPGSKADFSSVLQPWGVAFTGNYVIDPGQSIQQQPQVPAVVQYGTSDITKALGGTVTVYPLSTNITSPSPAPSGVTIVSLAQSSGQSYATSTQPTTSVPPKQPSDPSGPLTLALSVQQNVTVSPAATATPAAQPTTTGTATPAPSPTAGVTANQTMHLVLIGTSTFAANQVTQQVTGNENLMLATVQWMTGQQDLISIPAKSTDTRTMTMTNTQTNLAVYSSLLFLPLLVLFAGGAVWWVRR